MEGVSPGVQAAGEPSLAPAVLGGDDGMDAAALAFLLPENLRRQEAEAEERREEEERQRWEQEGAEVDQLHVEQSALVSAPLLLMSLFLVLTVMDLACGISHMFA